MENCRVGCIARSGRKYTEDGAEEEGEWVDGEELRFEAGGKIGRPRAVDSTGSSR